MRMLNLFIYALVMASSINLFADINASDEVVFIENKTALIKANEDLQNNIWLNKYKNYLTYNLIYQKIQNTKSKLKKLRKKRQTAKVRQEVQDLQRLLINREEEIVLLSEHKSGVLGNILNTLSIKEHSKITNPIMAISALSYIKQLKQKETDFVNIKDDLQDTIHKTVAKINILQNVVKLTLDKKTIAFYVKELKTTTNALDDFKEALSHLDTSHNVFKLKIQEISRILTKDSKNEIIKLIYIVVFIVFLIMIGFVIKMLLKKYSKKNNNIDKKSYLINKLTNALVVIISILVVFFSYIENVTYLVTVLGFASAGIAIAMKDWFMSMLGWLVMLMGGSVHVGDRIKIIRLGQEIVGDVLDISLLKITILEDITLTTYQKTRRAGRILFVPNHYIFDQIIFNYSHGGLKTVWDGIDFLITFDSNYKKAILISKDIATKYSKGYTDITRIQLNKLRMQYDLRSINVEPRVFSFIDGNGIKISIWYQTNSFSTLPLRSTISSEILTSFLEEGDIKIAYSTQTLNFNTQKKEDKFLDLDND